MIGRVWRFFRRWGLLGAVSRVCASITDRLHTRLYAAALGIKVGRGTLIYPGAKIRKAAGGKVVIGDRCKIHSGARILAYGGHVKLGNRCTLNPFSILYGHGGLDIGDRVLIAAGTIVVPANHNIALGEPIAGQGLTVAGIRIGSDVWLGSGVRVLDGSDIGDGAVVAAGAVVAGKTLEPDKIYGGVPARMIAERT